MEEGCLEPVPTRAVHQKPYRFQDSVWLRVVMSPCPSIQSLIVVRSSNFVIWLGRKVVNRQQWGPGLSSERTTLRTVGTQNPSEFLLKKNVAYKFAFLITAVALLL